MKMNACCCGLCELSIDPKYTDVRDYSLDSNRPEMTGMGLKNNTSTNAPLVTGLTLRQPL